MQIQLATQSMQQFMMEIDSADIRPKHRTLGMYQHTYFKEFSIPATAAS